MLGIDAASFLVLHPHYAKDRSKGYYVAGFGVIGSIKGATLVAFKALADGCASDGKTAFYKGAVITSANGDSLVPLEYMGYAKTQSQVFHNGALMPDADAASFVPVEKLDPDFDATDKNGSFSAGVRVKGAT